MSLKDDFLKINTYEEYDKERNKFKSLNYQDDEIREHFVSLFPILNNDFEEGVMTELYKTPKKHINKEWWDVKYINIL